MEKPARENIQTVYPLSPIQHGMLFHTLLEPGSGVYIPQTVLALNGAMDESAFARAWQLMMDRTDVLRTMFVRLDTDKPLQIVLKKVRSPLNILDWRQREDRQAALNTLVTEAWRKPFEISRAPLLRLTLVRWGEDEYRLVTTYHHALCDGWSLALVFNELFTVYQALASGETVQLAPPPAFKDYIHWLGRQVREASLVHWRDFLDGATPSGLGALLQSTATTHGNRIAAKHEVTWAADSALNQQLHAFAQEARVTLNIVFQAVWAVLLARLNSVDDVLFGATVSGRPAALDAVEHTIGPFINSVPVRAQVRADAELRVWLQSLQAAQPERDLHAYLALADIKQAAGLTADQLPFNSLIIFENFPSQVPPDGHPNALQVKTLYNVSQNNYPLSVVIFPSSTLHIKYKFDPTRISRESVAALSGQFAILLGQLVHPETRQVGDLVLPGVSFQPPAGERTPGDLQAVTQRFAAQVEASPESIALSDEAGSCTYAELDRCSSQLARYFVELGAGPGEQIAVALPRGRSLIEALLAALKCGAAYVPLDPQAPVHRLEQILTDAQPVILLTGADHLDRLQAADCDAELVVLERDGEDIAAAVDNLPLPTPDAEWPAYRIYTSGSTGRPKGVMVTHGNLDAYVQGLLQRVFLPPDARLAALSTVAADLGNTAIFGALLSGRTLRLLPEALNLDAAALATALRREPVTALKIVPSHLQALLAAEPTRDWVPPVLILGGEAIAPKWLGQLREVRPDVVIYNHYGPTEATIGAFCELLTTNLDEAPLGLPMAAATAHVLDQELNPVPVGAVGELYLGGAGLALGYAGQGRVTSEYFLPDPFSLTPGARLYRTGDRARVDLDGVLHFAGRIDHQVKLQGRRVELGEIEAVLRRAPGVRDAVALLSDGKLRAFLAGGETRGVKSWIQEQLPDYMQPSDWHCLAQLPLTGNGKLDRQALRALPWATLDSTGYSAPQTDLEQTLAKIWQELLKQERVGIEANFFDLGGNSLMLIQAHAKINAVCEGHIEIVDLFRYPSIKKLAVHIERLQTITPFSNDTGRNNGAGTNADELARRRQAQQRQQARARVKRRGLA
ncbi:MAG: amino acid adenylation domain-containing protein [Xanthomonadaceae bacterium]|nr:amino acid adenylation domain-containing protein [Xanthomonadaceae bacterium]